MTRRWLRRRPAPPPPDPPPAPNAMDLFVAAQDDLAVYDPKRHAELAVEAGWPPPPPEPTTPERPDRDRFPR